MYVCMYVCMYVLMYICMCSEHFQQRKWFTAYLIKVAKPAYGHPNREKDLEKQQPKRVDISPPDWGMPRRSRCVHIFI